MTRSIFPEGFRLEPLERKHPRRNFDCGEARVTDWLRTKALQSQSRHLSTTRVLLAPDGAIAGYDTLATGQVDFGDLTPEFSHGLPRRKLPVAVLAWLGVSTSHQGQGLGGSLLADALRNCYEAGQTFAFIAVILDCVNDAAKTFYQRWDFRELPGNPYRLMLSWNLLVTMMDTE